jgi:predicted phosphodiesterase
MASSNKIHKALEKNLKKARVYASMHLDPDKRFVIFSDHHKGARTGADDFERCESNYLNALEYYDEKLYTLVVLGDVEELWEEDIEDILRSYPKVFERESAFHAQNRYIRVYGNHDDFWHYPENTADHLEGDFPGLKPVDGLVLKFEREGIELGEILLVHGNQGVFDLGLVSDISRFFVRIFWRAFQIITGKGRTTPSEDACLRGLHDTWMYEWAATQKSLILVAGHTHRPVWSSMTHLEQLRDQLYRLQAESPRPPNFLTLFEQLQADIDKKTAAHPPCNDSVKTCPCYFNSGCCSYEDGDITGIELEGDWIRLVKWDKATGIKTILQEGLLTDIFALLPK